MVQGFWCARVKSFKKLVSHQHAQSCVCPSLQMQHRFIGECAAMDLQVSTGWMHSAAVGPHGELYAWGWGGSVGTATSYETGRSSGGQLGLGNEFDYWAPTQITDLQTAIQDKQPPESVAPAAEWRALQVSCGFNHTAAVVQIGNS